MNADEIRAKWESIKTAIYDRDQWQLFIMFEIAAQLAELNHKLSPVAKADAEKLMAQIKGHF